jgi:two-component sensor histidine kinase
VLSASTTQTLGLALHELATNATKYGAWASPSGRVDIRWEFEKSQPATLRLNWAETGGPRVDAPLHKGFGHIVFENMVEQSAHGEVEIDYNPAGLRWSVSLPIDPIAQ